MKGLQIVTWEKGMDQDSSKRKFPNNAYYTAKNVRVLSQDELDQGSIHTMTGNSQYTQLSSTYNSYSIIGYTQVGNWLVLFTTNNDSPGDKLTYSDGTLTQKNDGSYYSIEVEFSQGYSTLEEKETLEVRSHSGGIYKLQYYDTLRTDGLGNPSKIELYIGESDDNEAEDIYNQFTSGNTTVVYDYTGEDDVIWRVDLTQSSPTPEKVYEGVLGLSRDNPIYDQAIGYYFNEDIQKVYWTDGYNYLRSVNIADDLSTFSAGRFDIVPDVKLIRPQFLTTSGGSLPVGVVQYSYQLYRQDGSITTFSPASQVIHLTEASENRSNDKQYGGSDVLDEDGNPNNSGKSVSIYIDNLDSAYDYIRVARIYYARLDEAPQISIIDDRVIDSSDITVTDTSDIITDISLNLFRSINDNLFTCQSLASNKNILFAGDIDGYSFDIDQLVATGTTGYWDARAYRYNPYGGLDLYQDCETTDYTNWTIEYKNASYDWVVPYADAANLMNCPSRAIDQKIDDYFADNVSGDIGSISLFQSDGTTLGGEGKHISYEFTVDTRVIDDNAKNHYPYTNRKSQGYTNTSNPLYAGKFNGFKTDEIYSFGIIFYDDKKRASFVKWIGDIRFPRRKELSGSKDDIAFYYEGRVWGDILGITFNVDTSDIPSNITHFQIVRTPTRSEDRTILTTGIGSFAFSYDGDNNGGNDVTLRPHWYPLIKNDGWIPDDNPSDSDIKEDVMIFHSPELAYGSSIDNPDWVSVSNQLDKSVFSLYQQKAGIGSWWSYFISDISFNSNGWLNVNKTYFTSFKYTQAIPRKSSPTSVVTYNIVGTQESPDNTTDIGKSNPFMNYYTTNYDTGDTDRVAKRGPHATSIVMKLNSPIPDPDSNYNKGNAYLVDLKKERIPYGGYTFNNRQQRTYIACSDMVKVTGGTDSVTTFEGNTFLGYTEYLKCMFEREGDHENLHVRGFYPVESYINEKLTDRTYKLSQADDLKYRTLREDAGYSEFSEISLQQERDFYRYNSVYSQRDNSKLFFPAPENRTLYTKLPYTIRASERQDSDSLVDNWTQFPPGSQISVEARYSNIKSIQSIGNHLLFFQKYGMGTISVDERALVKTQNDISLQLGGSGLLSRFDYISKNIGCQHKGVVLYTDSGIYWYDQNSRKFCAYLDGLHDLGFEKNMASFFRGLSEYSEYNDNTINDSGIIAGHNGQFNEVWYTFYDGASDYKTLVYNYNLGRFTTFVDNQPSLYMTLNNKLYDIYSDDTEYIYAYDSDNYTLYNISYTPYVSFIISPRELDRSYVKTAIYDNLCWLSEKYSGDIIQGSTIDSLQFENDHQDSEQIGVVIHPTSGYNTRKLKRVWRFNQLRDASNNRLNDFYLKVTMRWSNQKFILHDVSVYYRT